MLINRAQGILLESGTNEVEFLRFSVGDTNCGINVSKVSQILTFDASKITSTPGGTKEFLGVFYFRNKPIPVYDLGLLLSIEHNKNHIPLLLVSEFNQRTIGYIIDEVFGIHRCSWDQFSPMEESFSNWNSECTLGTVTVEKNIVLILDFEAMMGKVDPTMSIENHAPADVAEEKRAQRKAVNIVYCEDSVVVQKVLLKTLRTAGYENVKIFSSGEEGYKYITQNEASVADIIISDIEMPGMDGLMLCKEVHTMNGWKELPFIIFSSMVNDHMKHKCKAVGANAAYSKPEVANIVTEIDSLCLE